MDKIKDKRLRKIFETICKENDKVIQRYDSILPICIIIAKDYSHSVIGIRVPTEEKEALKFALGKTIMLTKPLAYILVFDAYATTINQETKEKKVQDVCIRTLYCREGSFRNCVLHEGKKIISSKEFNNQVEKVDTWDFFGNTPNDYNEEDESFLKDYNDFKDKNRDLFKDL
jgi:hypothetical protein